MCAQETTQVFRDFGTFSWTLPDKDSLFTDLTRWGWACRHLDQQGGYQLVNDTSMPPRPGDVALVRIKKIGRHTRVMTAKRGRMRLYVGDELVSIFGNRYATDAFEAEVCGHDPLHLLTGAGMVGTVNSIHNGGKPPTELSFRGYLGDEAGNRINLKKLRSVSLAPAQSFKNVILSLGTSMNSGKTTTLSKLIKDLRRRGARIMACKLTGSVSHRDLFELESAGAHYACDFSDYGFPSTYLCEPQELRWLFNAVIADALQVKPDVLFIEVADGILQRETRMVLEDPYVQNCVQGVVLSARCAMSALKGIEEVEKRGSNIIAISGIISNSPLFVRELQEVSSVPVESSCGSAESLGSIVWKSLQL